MARAQIGVGSWKMSSKYKGIRVAIDWVGVPSKPSQDGFTPPVCHGVVRIYNNSGHDFKYVNAITGRGVEQPHYNLPMLSSGFSHEELAHVKSAPLADGWEAQRKFVLTNVDFDNEFRISRIYGERQDGLVIDKKYRAFWSDPIGPKSRTSTVLGNEVTRVYLGRDYYEKLKMEERKATWLSVLNRITHPVAVGLLACSPFIFYFANKGVFSISRFNPLSESALILSGLACVVGLPAAGVAAAFRKGARLLTRKPRTTKNIVSACLWGGGTLLALALYGVAFQKVVLADPLDKGTSQKEGPVVVGKEVENKTATSSSVPLIKPKAVRLPKESYKKTAHYRARRLAQASKQPRP